MTNIETIRQAFAPFAEALKANETDTLGRLTEGEKILFWTAGSWTEAKRVTLGDLRRLARAINAEPSGDLTADFQVWAFRDSHGNTAINVCEESSDTIQICGLKNVEGDGVYFESEAYHAPAWCHVNGISYSHREHTIEATI